MDSFGGLGLIGSSRTVRRKRSNPFRRPQDDSESLPNYRDSPSLSSTPPSITVSKASSDDNTGMGSNYRGKEQILNHYNSRSDAETALNRDERFGELNEAFIDDTGGHRETGLDFKRSTEDDIVEANWKSISGQSRVVSDAPGNENKPRKVKLKVGGVTHTLHTKSISDGSSLAGSSSTKSSPSSYAPHPGNKLIVQGKPDDDHSRHIAKQSGLRGVPWKDFSKTGFGVRKLDSSRRRMPEGMVPMKHFDSYEPARKSKRVPKRRLLRGALDDEDDGDDKEIRYLEKLKSSKSVAKNGLDYEDEVGSRKQRPISRVLNRNVDGYAVDTRHYSSSRSGKESKKLKSERASGDADYLEEESVSDTDPEPNKKKQRKELTNASGDSGQEMAVTTRRRALLAGKGTSSGSVASLIEFPNGLPPAPPKKQKEQLSEVEQQLKRAEALQRRRMQVEKANKESEAEAIRKILGQDSSRKKREEKIKKRQEELSQERTASSLTLASNAVRWVMGPSGTIVTFPDEMGLPSIFEQKSCSYPAPREKCAGPSCTNAYKYRDSKSKLPLCSLQCYKAIHEKMQQPLTAC